ncbi:hypothetical protein KORDIASMS9_04233 [Kordia sp. SMS9]|nr:hypothetical protein KORDIASMS9_04233 [Kordia sp. SMS9]
MKIQQITTLIIIFVTSFIVQANVQDGYTYTVIDNGSYS